MTEKRGAANCGWATPTLALPEPLWLDAWDAPWSCVREPAPRVLRTTTACAVCAHWEARGEPVAPLHCTAPSYD
jgi:hypothetical protein